jgi:maltooligosyltrehalose trehalohydrolase
MSDAWFGARPNGDSTSFRLWAPAAKRVDLVLERKPQPMRRGEDGWFSLDVSGAIQVSDRRRHRCT